MEATLEAFKTKVNQLSELAGYVGKTLGVTEWIKIEQKNIDTFSEAILDKQWIYTDTVAAEHSPYGTTVTPGFQILSLIPKMTYEVLHIGDAEMAVNYGLDKVRFPSAVRVDTNIRGIVELKGFEVVEGGARFKVLVTVEIENQERPACIGEFIVQVFNESIR